MELTGYLNFNEKPREGESITCLSFNPANTDYEMHSGIVHMIILLDETSGIIYFHDGATYKGRKNGRELTKEPPYSLTFLFYKDDDIQYRWKHESGRDTRTALNLLSPKKGGKSKLKRKTRRRL